MSFATHAGRDVFSTPPDPDALIAALAARQHGVVTLEQLFDAGLDREAIRRRVAARRLFRIHRGVYAVGHAGLSFDGRCMAAARACGEYAAVGHFTAAELWKASRWPVSVIAVVTATQHQPAGVEVHRCRRLDERDVTHLRGIPITTVARTLVDLSDTLTPHQLAWVIHEAAFRNRFHLEATRRAMERANGRHHLDRLEKAIVLHLSGSAGTRSAKEDDYLATLGIEALEAARVNTKIEVDVHWPGTATIVEIDGAPHARPSQRGEDERRDAALTAAGYDVTRIVG